MNQKSDNPPNLPKGEHETVAPRALHLSIEDAAMQNFLWNLLVDNCVRLQMSSASIKAGVTSLLDPTIFWASSTQYEFYRSIDESIDEIADLATLMMLAFRIQANRLELKIESQDLKDILSRLRDQPPCAPGELELDIHFPPGDVAVNIDYSFFLIALKLLIGVESDVPHKQRKVVITITAAEKTWFLDVAGVQPDSIDFLQQLGTHRASVVDYDHHQADKLLRLTLAYWICQLQGVDFIVAPSQIGPIIHLRLAIPAT